MKVIYYPYSYSLVSFPETTTIVSSRYILHKSCICKYKQVYMCVCTCLISLSSLADWWKWKFTFLFPFEYTYIYTSISFPFLSHMVAGCSLWFSHLLYLCDCVISIHLGAAFLFLMATSVYLTVPAISVVFNILLLQSPWTYVVVYMCQCICRINSYKYSSGSKYIVADGIPCPTSIPAFLLFSNHKV